MDKNLDPIGPNEVEELLRLVDSSLEDPQVSVYDVDLKELLSSTLGLMNPIGQIAEWIINWFKNALAWIAEQIMAVAGWIYEKIVKPVLDTLARMFGEFAKALYENIIEPVFGAVAIASEKIKEFFEKVWEGFVEFWKDPLGKLKEAYEHLVTQLWELLPDWLKSIIETIGNVFEAIRKGFEEFAKNPAEWLKKHVVDPLWNVIGPVVEAFGKIAEFLKETWENIVGFFKDPAGWISKNVIGPLKNFAVSVAETIWSILPEPIKNFITGIQEFFANLAREASEFARDPIGWFNTRVVKPFVEGLSGAVKSLWDLLPDPIKNFITAVRNFFDTLVKEAGEFAKDPLRWFSSRVIEPIISGLKGVVKSLWDLLPEPIKDAVKGVEAGVKGICDFFNIIAEEAKEFVRDPIGWFNRKLVQPLKGALGYLAEKFWNLLPDWVRSVLERIPRVIEDVKKALEGFFRDPIGTLRRAFADIGRWIWEALPPWFRSVIEGVRRALESLYNAVLSFFRDPVGAIRSALSRIGEWIWGALPPWVKSTIEFIGRVLVGIKDALFNFFRDPVGTLQKALRNIGEWIWSKLPEGVREALERLSEFVRRLWEAIGEPKKFFQVLAEGFREAWGFIWNIVKPIGALVVEALEWFIGLLVRTVGRIAVSATKTAMEATEPIVEDLTVSSKSKFTNIFWRPLERLVNTIRSEWYEVLKRARGEIELVMDFGSRFGLAYFNAVILAIFF